MYDFKKIRDNEQNIKLLEWAIEESNRRLQKYHSNNETLYVLASYNTSDIGYYGEYGIGEKGEPLYLIHPSIENAKQCISFDHVLEFYNEIVTPDLLKESRIEDFSISPLSLNQALSLEIMFMKQRIHKLKHEIDMLRILR